MVWWRLTQKQFPIHFLSFSLSSFHDFDSHLDNCILKHHILHQHNILHCSNIQTKYLLPWTRKSYSIANFHISATTCKLLGQMKVKYLLGGTRCFLQCKTVTVSYVKYTIEVNWFPWFQDKMVSECWLCCWSVNGSNVKNGKHIHWCS